MEKYIRVYTGTRCRDCRHFKQSENPRFGYCKCKKAIRYERTVPAVLFSCMTFDYGRYYE